MISVTRRDSPLYCTLKSPRTLPNLPRSSSPDLSFVVHRIHSSPESNSVNLFLAARPNTFSSKSLVRDSGVSIPITLTRSSLIQIPNPKSMFTSTVSPSTTLSNSALYSYIFYTPKLSPQPHCAFALGFITLR